MEVYDAAGNRIDTSPKVLAWVAFEDEVAKWIEDHLRSWFGLRPETAQIKRRARYYSPRRLADIIFDVAVEVFPAGSPETPVLIWLFECKDYPARLVTVDEIEEFRNKMEQVGAHKGTVVTRCGFQKSAIEVASPTESA